ncbi:MAG: dihydrofolate reductase family protein [Thermoanaerobaculia bacterium]
MGRVVVCTNITLDGVMQAPARPDEDTRNGFAHGGWAAPYAAMAHAGHVFSTAGALLLGRRTYEDFYSVWPKRTDSPITPWLNSKPKYVASRTLSEPLPWSNSTLLKGDVVAAVGELKREFSEDILIMGSGELIRSLLPVHLIDEFVLLIHPLALGSGLRLFGEEGVAHLRLVSSSATPTGVVVATYHP